MILKKLKTSENADSFIRMFKTNLNEIVRLIFYKLIFTNKAQNLELKQKKVKYIKGVKLAEKNEYLLLHYL